MLPFDQQYQVGFLDFETRDILVRIYYPTTETLPIQSKYTDSAKQYAWGMSTFIKSKFLYPIIASIFYFHKGYLKPGATLCTDKKWPVMIFSHGLSGQRLLYSQYIGELVSLGMIVFALEHRDQSAAASAVNGYQKWIFYQFPNFNQKPSNQSNEEFERDFRLKQMDIRKREIQFAVTLAESLNKGEFIDNLMQKRQRIILQDEFKNCMDLKQLFIGGHSFGVFFLMTHVLGFYSR
jgi:platelet-activating factor acetylhydrolase